MAVAAYASMLSLMHVLDSALHPSRRCLLPNTSQIQTLRENLASFLDFLQVHHSKIIGKIESLARKIPAITQEADDMIDDHMLVLIIHDYHGYLQDTNLLRSFCRRVERVDKKINSIKKKMLKKLTGEDRKMGISCLKPKVEDAIGSSGDQKRVFSDSSFFQSIKRVIQKIDSKQKKSPLNDQKLKGPIRANPSEVAFGNKSRNVGLEKSLLEVMDKLTSNQLNLQVIPIVGMPGIGKTTLARSAFHSKYTVDNFTIRIWISVSQEFDLHRVLKGLSDDGIIGDSNDNATNVNASDLGQALYQMLCGRKYLIVLDDVWSIQAWDDLRSFFPNNSNGSRIVVTTRMSDVANLLGPRNTYSMEFLDEENSWDLLSGRAFARGNQSPELVEIGKKIARSCRGLPLSLVVVGGLLANSDMTPAYWELVSKNVGLYANSEDDENCLKILSLSYDYLPLHLKPCFLYMAVFGEDDVVHVSDLVKMWNAAGFLRPASDKIPEEVALGYLKDLIDRNIIEIRKRGSRGNIKSCGIHDLLRDLCIRECIKEDLFRVPRMQEFLVKNSHESLCSFCAEEGEHESVNLPVVNLFPTPSMSSVPSLVCSGCRKMYPELNRIRFVRVIDTIEGVPTQILQTTKARYLRITHLAIPVEFADPSAMTLLWNLQTLYAFTFDHCRIPVSDIWEMPLLRHVNVGSRMLSDPTILTQTGTSADDFTVLESLQILTRVSNFRCTEEVVRRIPNLKKLGLTYEWRDRDRPEVPSWSHYCLYNLDLLQKLESLSLRFTRDSFSAEYITFPYSLKKLSFFACLFSWEDINYMVGSLPNLEVLKLNDTMTGIEWSPPEEGFLRLKHLQMKRLELIWWIADETHFPVLENLIIANLSLLESIPSSFGNIDTLQSITLDYMRDSVIDSVREMIEEQHSNGNESLRLHVTNPTGPY